MDWLQNTCLKLKIHALGAKILRNKATSLCAFILLIAAIFFITIHPKSVWYYFAAGFFLCRMLELIFQKIDLSLQLENAINTIRKGITI